MAFTVVLDVPGGLTRRTVRGLRMLFGTVAMTVGSLSLLVASVLTFGSLLMLFGAFENPGWDWWWPALWLSWIAGVAATWLGGSLLAGQRRLALLLRRFRRTETTDVISAAVRRFGLVWRLVTLDDDEVRATGVGRAASGFAHSYDATHALAARAERGGARSLTLVWIGIAGMVIALVATVVATGLDRLDVAAEAGLTLALDWSEPWSGWTVVIFRAGAVLAGLGVVLWAVLRLVRVPAGVLGMFDGTRTSIEQAEGAKLAAIRDREGIATAAARIADQSTKLISPRLFVLHVDSSVWRETVLAFAQRSTVPLIDVSEPSQHLLWEVRELLRRFDGRVVLIGELQQLGRMFDHPRPGSPEAALQLALEGREVLGYTTDEPGRRRFARALRATLDRHAATAAV